MISKNQFRLKPILVINHVLILHVYPMFKKKYWLKEWSLSTKSGPETGSATQAVVLLTPITNFQPLRPWFRPSKMDKTAKEMVGSWYSPLQQVRWSLHKKYIYKYVYFAQFNSLYENGSVRSQFRLQCILCMIAQRRWGVGRADG